MEILAILVAISFSVGIDLASFERSFVIMKMYSIPLLVLFPRLSMSMVTKTMGSVGRSTRIVLCSMFILQFRADDRHLATVV